MKKGNTMGTKIIILGGGISALTTAFDLTSDPAWRDRFEITIYQIGWRLGGKGASSRNEAEHDRIEEHGLHIWLGFYENAFALIRQCYGELNRPQSSPIRTWRDAFLPQSFMVLEDRYNDQWSHWPCEFPTNGDIPGDGRDLPSLWVYLQMSLEWAENFLASHPVLRLPDAAPRPSFIEPPWWADMKQALAATAELTTSSVGLALVRMAIEKAKTLSPDPNEHSAIDHQAIHWLMQRVSLWLHGLGGQAQSDPALRRTWIIADLIAAVVRGVLADGLMYNGLDAIDHYEFREWLGKHGATDTSLQSAWVRGGYDLAFSFIGGRSDSPSMAAGVALRSLFRLVLGYKGAILWKMRAGMGETIFTPLYEVLRQRGVKFCFFHRVTNLRLSADKTRVEAVELLRQATPHSSEYEPLVDVKGLKCWPGHPLYDQLNEGDQLKSGDHNLESFWTTWRDVGKVELRAEIDFNQIVLGIPIACFAHICGELIAQDRRWEEMIKNVKTIQTQGFQLWLTRNLAACGWEMASPVLGAYVEPIDTWSDMSHLLEMESWLEGARPMQLAYFVGVMEDAGIIPGPDAHDFPAAETERTRQTALDFLRTDISYLWPRTGLNAAAPMFDWNVLVAPEGTDGEERFAAQYWRANIDPSERYVLAVPGTTGFRLRTGESGFINLVLTGDWIRNGFNSPGCIESAVISGRQAARFINGGTYRIIGETDTP